MDSMMDWKQQWEADQRAQQETLALLVQNDNAILQELADARTQREAMMTAQFEMKQHSDKQNEMILQLLTAFTQTVKRTTDGGSEKLPPWFLPRHEVRFDPTPFARGSYATLHRGVLGFDQKVVVKCFLVDGMAAGEEAKKQIEAEIALWHRFNNQNVIRMFGASHVSSPPFIACEDATNGDLRSFLTIGDNKQHMWRLLYQAALGLEYLHKLKVVHGDLKLNNILVGADGQAKLADFGLSAESASSDSTVVDGLLQAKPDHFKDMAACVVQNLTRNIAAHIEIERQGGIAQLVALTQKGTGTQKQFAAAALSNFTTNPGYLATIARDGGIISLIGLLRSGTDGQKHFAGRALANMSLADDIAAEIVAAGGVGPLISLLRTGTEEQKCALVEQ